MLSEKKTKIKTISLSKIERERLRDGATRLVYPIAGSYEPFIRASLKVILNSLNADNLDAVSAIKNDLSSEAPVMFTGLPFDKTVKRGMIDPERNNTDKPNDLSEVLLTGFTAMIGEPYAIKQTGRGLISNLSPVKERLMSNSGLGAKFELSLHIENAAGRLLPGDRSPDGLALIGVSPEKGGSPGTIIADGRLALSRVSERHVEALSDTNNYLLRMPERWRGAGIPEFTKTAIVNDYQNNVTFIGAFYGDMLRPMNSEAAVALNAFRAALEAVSVDVKVNPGTLVLLDNRVLWHGRREFEAKFDELGRPYRFIQRLFWTSSLRRFGMWERERKRLVIAGS